MQLHAEWVPCFDLASMNFTSNPHYSTYYVPGLSEDHFLLFSNSIINYMQRSKQMNANVGKCLIYSALSYTARCCTLVYVNQ